MTRLARERQVGGRADIGVACWSSVLTVCYREEKIVRNEWMPKKVRRLPAVVGAVLALSMFGRPAPAYDRLQPFAGTLAAGGHLAFPMAVDRSGDFAMHLTLTPELGFFVADGWELVLQGSYAQGLVGLGQKVAMGTPAQPLADLADKEGGFALGFRYLFDGGFVLPYLGVLMGFFWPQDAPAMQIRLGLPIGLLIPFNDYVALDLGMPIAFVFPVDTGFDRFTITPGFLGIRAFF